MNRRSGFTGVVLFLLAGAWSQSICLAQSAVPPEMAVVNEELVAQNQVADIVHRYDGRSFRNPFKSALPIAKPSGSATPTEVEIDHTSEPVEPPKVTVQGLLWGSARPQAIIDNRIVEPGDSVAGAEVLAIDRSGVTVIYRGFEYVLRPPLPVRPIGTSGGG
ncbi:MAG: hypothetical protein JW937_10615 [Candidatus Omnitrophica bacterium]|nr:hypothetical protein [Candidatus Omnitrophota bacterium]